MSGEMGFRLDGDDLVVRFFQALRGELQSTVAEGMVVEGQQVMTQAKTITPVDTGALRASGEVLPPEIGTSSVTVTLSFPIEYALWVHENLEAHHPVGQAKFLETPFLAALPHMPDHLAVYLDRRMGRML